MHLTTLKNVCLEGKQYWENELSMEKKCLTDLKEGLHAHVGIPLSNTTRGSLPFKDMLSQSCTHWEQYVDIMTFLLVQSIALSLAYIVQIKRVQDMRPRFSNVEGCG